MLCIYTYYNFHTSRTNRLFIYALEPNGLKSCLRCTFQHPIDPVRDKACSQLQTGQRFESESKKSSCGYEIVEGGATVFIEVNNKEKNKEDDDSSYSNRNVVACKLRKGDCFGFISDSWSAVAGTQDFFPLNFSYCLIYMCFRVSILRLEVKYGI